MTSGIAGKNLKIFNMIRPFYIALLIFILLTSCGNISRSGQGDDPVNWSVRMAEAVMQRSDSLIYYNNPEKVKWSYDVAMLGLAVDRLGSQDPKYSVYLKEYVDYFVTPEGKVRNYKIDEYNLDRINPARNILTLYKRTGEEKYLKAIDLFVTQMEDQPRTASGGYWHKKIYPDQMWLDGIYMSAPFMAQYAQEFNRPEWFDQVAGQIVLIYNKTLDQETGLLYHAWDESRKQQWADPETGCSPHFWGRAMGWYMMALVDVLEFVPERHPQFDTIRTILQHTSEALLKVRDPDTGLWYQVLDRKSSEGNYLEASCSCMITYAFAKGARKKYLPGHYREIAGQCFESILNEFVIIDKDGLPSLVNICGSAGLGGDPYRDGSYEYYVNERKVTNDPKGVGPFILAAIELKR
jgi:unsaturated rhamnogalacturonyl hydrolase